MADLSEHVTEQLRPIIDTVLARVQADLSDRDKAAIAHALVDASIMGARVSYAGVVADAVQAGLKVPPDPMSGLQSENLWPFND
jgi:hypothetical protein